MAQSKMHTVNALVTALLRHRVVKFLIVGALSFALDLGLLILLHEGAGVVLWLATPVAFIASLLFNFMLQRRYTFQATNKSHISAFKYGLLVLFNILATDAIVLLFADTELTYATGKIVSTVSTMVWNFFIYKYWIFPHVPPAAIYAPDEAGTGTENEPGRHR